jgi:hypothetical protein
MIRSVDLRFIDENENRLKVGRLSAWQKTLGMRNSESRYTVRELDWIKQHLSTLNLPSRITAQWFHSIDHGVWSAESAFLLTLLPNLTHITLQNLTKDFASQKHFLNIALSTGRVRWPGGVLQTLSLRCDEKESTYSNPAAETITLDDIADTLFNSSIHTLELSNMRKAIALFWEDREREYSDRQLGIDPLWTDKTWLKFKFKRLKLTDCDLPEATLQHLVKACPALEGLVYHHPLYRPFFDFHVGRFGDHIAHLRATLKDLEVHQPLERNSNSYETNNERPRIPWPLTDFSELKTLSISAHLLIASRQKTGNAGLDVDVENTSTRLSNLLPPSIETLKMIDCELSVITPAISELLDCKSEFPGLKSITLVIAKGGSADARNVKDVDTVDGAEILDSGAEKGGKLREAGAEMRLGKKLREDLEVAAWESDVKLVLVE